MKRILKFFGYVVLVLALLVGGFFIYGLSLVRKLPWQKPHFDTERPADPGQVGINGVLVFSKTNGFRHSSIGPGVTALERIGKERGWNVVSTENGAFFNDDYLKRFKVVVWLSTTGDVLTPDQEKAFERYMAGGGGYVGIHSACDTEYEWPFYDKLVGTHFRDHSLFPHTPEGTLVTEDTTHAATAGLPARWRKVEEWYNFKQNPRNVAGVKVLVNVDEKTYDVGETGGMAGDHPISWVKDAGKGRMFYTALGHTDDTFQSSLALTHITNGIRWAGRLNDSTSIVQP